MKLSNELFFAALIASCSFFTYAADKNNNKMNPTDIGNFDKRQFIAQGQGLTLGKDIANILGYIAIAGNDGSLTITSCRKVTGTSPPVTTADLTQPVFSAVIDGSWGLKVSLSFLDISNDGNTKLTLTATDIADAVLPQSNIPDSLSAPINGCALPSTATLYYIQKATLTLVTKTTYIKTGGGGGILSFLKISGAEYDQTNQTNMYTVSVFASPIYSSEPSKLTVAKSPTQIESLNGKIVALGIDKSLKGSKAATLDTKFSTALKPAILSKALKAKFSEDDGH